MTIKKKHQTAKIQLDLTGPEGNSFVLLGTCRRIAKTLDMDWEVIEKEATSGDYDHLVKTLDKHFGQFVDFLT